MLPIVVLSTAIGTGAVALTVWLHEVGHSATAYLLGCKENWWQTSFNWFLFNSDGGNIDYACLATRGHGALALMAFGGIAVNLLLLGMLTVALNYWSRFDLESRRPLVRFGFVTVFVWALANYAEAFSYLILNSILLKSDMETVVTDSAVSRWLWLCAGTSLAIAFAIALRAPTRRAAAILGALTGSSAAWSRRFLIYAASVGSVMAVARGILR